jgi:ketosteroid isomerase-like protein
MPNDNLRVKDRFVAAVFAGDKATMHDLLDASFELHQPPGLAYAGSYAGAEGFLSFLAKFMATYDIEALVNTDTFIAENPDRTVLEFKFTGKLKASGEKFATTLLECWEFRQGRILRITVYWFAMPRAA